MKKTTSTFFIIFLIAFSVLLSGCGAGTNTAPDPNTDAADTAKTTGELKSFTREELKKYNGQNGNPAYVAVDGKVYDVTNVGPWKGGKHNGNEAGNDLTEVIKTKSPHGVKVLEKVPVVGELVD